MSNDYDISADPGLETRDQLCLMASRSCIMILDAALRVLPAEAVPTVDFAGSATSLAAMAVELRSLARRVIRTAQDFTAALPQGIAQPHGTA